MSNHEFERKRPTYFAMKIDEILWFVPLSSKVLKYEKIINDKIKKYSECKTIIIGFIAGKKHAILIQNAFPIIEKYVDHIHIYKNRPLKVINSLRSEISNNLNFLLSMKSEGKNLFFVDIDKIKLILENEIKVK